MINYKEFRESVQKDFDNELNVTDDLKGLSPAEVQDVQRSRSLPYAVCALNVTGNINISTMVRTAVIFGAERFFLMGRKVWDKRGTVGAQNYIDMTVESAMKNEVEIDAVKVYSTIVAAGYRPIVVDTCEPEMVQHYNFTRPEYNPVYCGYKSCLIFGNEGLGLPQDLIDLCGEDKVTIPQIGVMRSLNVSTAAGIIMWHVANELNR